MIEAQGVSFSHGSTAVVRDASLSLKTGELTVVVGPNGAGKSTLLKLLAGQLMPTKGRVVIEGRDLLQWNAADLASRRAVLSQAVTLSFPFTVTEIAELALQHLPAARRQAISSAVLHELCLDGFAPRLVQHLSGGEQQRVHLARVLCQLRAQSHHGRQFLFLDEPTSSLDIKHQVEVLDMVRRRVSEQLGALIVLHDLNLAASLADRLIIMRDGGIISDGPPSATMTPELLSEIYGIGMRKIDVGGRPHFVPGPLTSRATLRAAIPFCHWWRRNRLRGAA